MSVSASVFVPVSVTLWATVRLLIAALRFGFLNCLGNYLSLCISLCPSVCLSVSLSVSLLFKFKAQPKDQLSSAQLSLSSPSPTK